MADRGRNDQRTREDRYTIYTILHTAKDYVLWKDPEDIQFTKGIGVRW